MPLLNHLQVYLVCLGTVRKAPLKDTSFHLCTSQLPIGRIFAIEWLITQRAAKPSAYDNAHEPGKGAAQWQPRGWCQIRASGIEGLQP